jgi:DNA replication protein DnaC
MRIIDARVHAVPEDILWRVFCHCHLDEIERAWAERWALTSVPIDGEPLSITDFKLVGSYNNQQLQRDLLSWGERLIASPFRHPWIMLTGGVGTGKTMYLRWLHQQLKPYSIYMPTRALIRKLFDSFDAGGDATSTLYEELVQVPVLLLDDLGVEETKTKALQNNITQIIDARYALGFERPTVVTTNLTPQELKRLNERTADRILDSQMVGLFGFTHDSMRTNPQQTEPEEKPVTRRLA